LEDLRFYNKPIAGRGFIKKSAWLLARAQDRFFNTGLNLAGFFNKT
jgi:hypothetical protein